jgi:hypothetical protein
MMEVTGEVCQSELLTLVEDGELTDTLKSAIETAVTRVQEGN